MQSSVHIGSILTGSKLINNYEFRSKLLRDFSEQKPIGGEMEAQGIYLISRLYGVSEWIIVKGICDWGFEKDNPNKENDQKIAANAAIDYCYHVFMRDGVFDHLIKKRNNNYLDYLFRNRVVFIDTCSCLHEQFPIFIEKIIPYVSKYNTKIYISYLSIEKLINNVKNMSISSRAQYALSKIYRLNDEGYIEIRGKASDKYVKSSILQNLLKYVACYNIILITQDAVLANNIFSLNNYDNKIIVKKINKNGNLKGFKKVN